MNFKFPRGREPFNGWSHFFATILAVVGSALLMDNAGDRGAMLYAKMFYSITLISAFGSSAIYHLAITTPERLRILRNIDHACILALMIGTYVPLSVALFPAHWKILLLLSLVILVLAAIRLAGEKSRRVISFSYITLASLPAISVPFLWEEHWRNILWFSLGSCFYSIGAFSYIKKFPTKNTCLKFHEVWHLCVMLGALVHFLVIYHLR